MSKDSETGSNLDGQIVIPMLLECDRAGRVLWASKRTRTLLRDPKQLTDIIAVKNLSHPNYGFEISNLRDW